MNPDSQRSCYPVVGPEDIEFDGQLTDRFVCVGFLFHSGGCRTRGGQERRGGRQGEGRDKVSPVHSVHRLKPFCGEDKLRGVIYESPAGRFS